MLCIGYSESEIDELVAKYNPASIEALTNWEDHGDAKVKKYSLTVGDITKKTPFSDNEFDSILTLSVLEHLADIPASFLEMRRLVKHSGEILHFFGPAWSSPYGHHCYAKQGDEFLDFCQWKIPAHIHLLCTKAEIVDFFLSRGYAIDEANTALHWYFETPFINRVFFDAYMDLMSEMFSIDRVEYMRTELPVSHLSLLRLHFPGRRDFSAYGAKIRLIVEKD